MNVVNNSNALSYTYHQKILAICIVCILCNHGHGLVNDIHYIALKILDIIVNCLCASVVIYEAIGRTGIIIQECQALISPSLGHKLISVNQGTVP